MGSPPRLVTAETQSLPRVVVPTPPFCKPLCALEPWQSNAICLALLAILLPLLTVPWMAARALVGSHPLLVPIVAGVVGTSVALGTFHGCARVVGVPTSALFFRLPTSRTLTWVGIGACLGGLLALLTVGMTEGTASFGADTGWTIGGGLAAGVALGVWTSTVEELWLRGAILSIIGHQYGWPSAIASTAVLFGLMHNAHADTTVGTWVYVAITATAGLLFAFITLETGNVWNAVAVHASWNTLFSEHVLALGRVEETVPVIQYEIAQGPWFLRSAAWMPTESPVVLGLFLVAVGAYLFAGIRTRASNPEEKDTDIPP